MWTRRSVRILRGSEGGERMREGVRETDRGKEGEGVRETEKERMRE